MDTPAADVDVDEALVRRLLTRQHPDLADRELTRVASGWDNVLFRLGGDLVVRLPRRLVAAELVEHEQRWLPEIARRVGVAVPLPVRVGEPDATFPYRWTISAWLDGERAIKVRGEAFARDLAAFVRELHVDAPPDAPVNPVRGVPLASREATVTARLASGLIPSADRVGASWRRALRADAWKAAPRWIHGDLHPGNLLALDNRLSAVIDFGDIAGGDPATDLATAWLTLDEAGRAVFRDSLDYDEATWLRASGWAIVLASAFLAHSTDNPVMKAIGADALHEVLLDTP